VEKPAVVARPVRAHVAKRAAVVNETKPTVVVSEKKQALVVQGIRGTTVNEYKFEKEGE
jgi:RNase P/RNase MRP subunit p29